MSETRKRRTEITIETHQVTVISTLPANRQYCPSCGHRVSVFAAEQLAEVFQNASSEVSRRIVVDKLHLAADDGLICGMSPGEHMVHPVIEQTTPKEEK